MVPRFKVDDQFDFLRIQQGLEFSPAAGGEAASLINKKTLLEIKRGMDSYFKENNWTGSTRLR
jgi:hypothetical protein